MSVSLEHREANASVMKFFYDLLRAGRSREDRDDYEVNKDDYGVKRDDCGVNRDDYGVNRDDYEMTCKQG